MGQLAPKLSSNIRNTPLVMSAGISVSRAIFKIRMTSETNRTFQSVLGAGM